MKTKFIDNSAKILQAFSSKVGVGLNMIGSQAHRHLVDLTPRRTGNLANHADWEVDEAEQSVTIGFKHDDDPELDPDYAIYVEDGSINNKAHHMVRKAATEHDAEYENIMKKAMK